MSNKKYAYNYDIEECNQLLNALEINRTPR